MNSSNELIQRPRNKQFKAEPKELLDEIRLKIEMVGIPTSGEPAVEGGGISDFDITVGSDFHRGFF